MGVHLSGNPKGHDDVNTPPEETAVARRDPQLDLSEVMLDGPLRNMAQAWAIAKVVAQSSMVPGALRGSPQNVLVTMMLGQELDLTWTQSTRGIYVLPNGTPGLRGQLLLALIRKRGHRYTFERADDSCTCIITRKDEDFKIPYKGTFSLDDALAAGLVTEKDGKLFARSHDGKPLPWQQYRRDMLQWRAVARAAGIGAPEVIYGFDIAGIGDGSADGAVSAAPGPAQPGGTGPGQVFTAEVVAPEQDARQKLAELNAEMGGGQHLRGPGAQTQATADHMQQWQDGKETRPGEAQPADDALFPEDGGVAGAHDQGGRPEPGQQRGTPPGYDDLAQLLRRCGFHADAQHDLVSALVHRDIGSLGDLSKGEVLIAHDVITRAIKNEGSTVGARRAALTRLAAAERDAMQSQDEEATWADKD